MQLSFFMLTPKTDALELVSTAWHGMQKAGLVRYVQVNETWSRENSLIKAAGAEARFAMLPCLCCLLHL